MAGLRACFLGAFAQAVAGQLTTLAPTTMPCELNLTQVCPQMVQEAEAQCREYQRHGVTNCLSWRTVTTEACYSTCANCTQIAVKVRDECRFSLQIINDGELLTQLCDATQASMENFRCPALRNVNDGRCETAEADMCMRDCGNYGDCMCSQQKPWPIDDMGRRPLCTGFTRSDVVEAYPDQRFDCGMTPYYCLHYKATRCGKYKYCQPDLCLIKQVQCVPPEDCLMFDMCDKSNGLCHFRHRPDGYNCSDRVPWTVQDTCKRGLCVGTVDNCIRYNVTCNPLSPCTTGGTCHQHSGRCTFGAAPDGTPCDDGRMYTLEDRCQNGICQGKTVDLCKERSVVCTSPGPCFDAGACDPLTGRCSEAVATAEPRPCDDGDPATVEDRCIDGLCLGKLTSGIKFLTLGKGECTDREGNRMARYSGDVENEDECRIYCEEDPQCTAYSFAYPLCSLYGTVRTRAPSGGRQWAFQEGSLNPPAIRVEEARIIAVGQRGGSCRRKGNQRDTEQDYGPASRFNTDDFFEPWKVALYCVLVVVVFCFWPILRALERLFRGMPSMRISDIFMDQHPEKELLQDPQEATLAPEQLRQAAGVADGPTLPDERPASSDAREQRLPGQAPQELS